jgi:predicted nucleic acid-binding protein
VNYLLDTNVVSEATKPRPNPDVMRWLRDTDEDSVWISVVTFAELRQGLDAMPSGERRHLLDRWLDFDLPARFEGRIIGIGISVALTWGSLRARSTRRGRGLEGMDGFLAAIALVRGMTLVTRNVRDFQETGIETFNPWSVSA